MKKKWGIILIYVAAFSMIFWDLFTMPSFEFQQNYNKDQPADISEGFLPERLVVPSLFTQMRTRVGLLLGNRNISGIYIGEDRLVVQPEKISESNIVANRLLLSRLAERKGRINMVVIPKASTIYIGSTTQREDAMKSLQRQLPQISFVETRNYLSIQSEKQVYYNSEDGLAPLGGYYAYLSLGRRMGFQPSTLDAFNIRYSPAEFYGGLSLRSGYYGVEKDRYLYYYYGNGEMKSNELITPSGTYIWEDAVQERLMELLQLRQTFWTMETHREEKTGHLLLIADRDGMNLLPFLEVHYGKVTVVSTDCNKRLAMTKINGAYDNVLIAVNEDALLKNTLFSGFSAFPEGF